MKLEIGSTYTVRSRDGKHEREGKTGKLIDRNEQSAEAIAEAGDQVILSFGDGDTAFIDTRDLGAA